MHSPVDSFSIHDLAYSQSIEHHIDPTDHYHNHTHNIYTKPIDVAPKFQYLAASNYLSEFKTAVDKARVRFNLGIPDEYSFNWGNISGSIENLEDLMKYITDNNKKQEQLLKDITDLKEQLGILSDDSSSSIADSLKADINKLWASVATNSTDIATLYKLLSAEGGSTVPPISDSDAIAILTLKIAALENKLSGYDTLLADVESLKREISSNELIEIVASNTSWNVTSLSDNIPIVITAKYSLAKDKDITDLCNVVSSDRNVATWDASSRVIVINHSLIEAAEAELTFAYNGLSTVVSIKVSAQLPAILYKQYVGWGQDYSLILSNSKFECDTVAKKWANIESVGMAPYYLFIITTQNITNISSAIGPYDLTDLLDLLITHNGVEYTVYKLGPAKNTEAEITISI